MSPKSRLNPRLGKQHMTSHRNIFLTLGLLVVFAIFSSSSALANSLLSGYGGPGEGNQAILGSALVGGAGGAGGGDSSGGSSGSNNGSTGSTGSSPGATTGDGASAGLSEAASTGSSEGGSTSSGGSGSAAGRTSGSQVGSGKTSGVPAHAYLASSRGDVTQFTSGGWRSLGVSDVDLGYVLLALGALGVTGVVTRRLAQVPSGPEGL